MVYFSHMEGALFLKEYLLWHYGEGTFDLLRIWRNFLWFIPHAFSFRTLLRTLFSPWRRLGERTREGFHPEELAENLLINLIMRGVGFFLRTVLFGIGLLSLIFLLVAGVALVFLWVFAPIVLGVLIVVGIKLLI